MEKEKNTQSKTVKKENAYEVWRSFNGDWIWYVLKKYQAPSKEKLNQYRDWKQIGRAHV